MNTHPIQILLAILQLRFLKHDKSMHLKDPKIQFALQIEILSKYRIYETGWMGWTY